MKFVSTFVQGRRVLTSRLTCCRAKKHFDGMSHHQSAAAAAAAAMSLRLLVTSKKVSLCANNIGSISPLEMMAIDYLYNGPCYIRTRSAPSTGYTIHDKRFIFPAVHFRIPCMLLFVSKNTVGWVYYFNSLFFLSF